MLLARRAGLIIVQHSTAAIGGYEKTTTALRANDVRGVGRHCRAGAERRG
jgi:hypothetical protein